MNIVLIICIIFIPIIAAIILVFTIPDLNSRNFGDRHWRLEEDEVDEKDEKVSN